MIESNDPLTFFFLTLLLDRIRSIDLCNSFFFFFFFGVSENDHVQPSNRGYLIADN